MMRSPKDASAQQENFSLTTTRAFLFTLVVLYFLFPSVVAQFLLDNTFYIYSSYQEQGNEVSVVFGLFLILWILFVVPSSVARSSPFLSWIARSFLFRSSYYLFLIYLLLACLYGAHMRAGGAERFDLLVGEDSFLFPGMGLVLINCATYCVVARSFVPTALVGGLCLAADAVFDGKIFSFLAAGMLFFRLDYAMADRRLAGRIFFGASLLAFVLLVATGVSRASLAGEDINTEFLALVYLAGSEFMGIQASAGWATGYHIAHQPMALLGFVSTLQDSYINAVGHGLGASPAAYFVANFGNWGIATGLLALTAVGSALRRARSRLGWIILLVVTLNFQHLLRHGFDVFAEKLVVQISYFCLLYLGSSFLCALTPVQTSAIPRPG